MTQEEKDLLLKDLCARLPYELKYNFGGNDGCDYTIDSVSLIAVDDTFPIKEVKPYLRPMSSMTDEEFIHYGATREWKYVDNDHYEYFNTLGTFDWLLAHHFDFRGLIEKGLALEAPEGMYES